MTVEASGGRACEFCRGGPVGSGQFAVLLKIVGGEERD
jgi:hypothetical protein